jgi:hypothetical protein
VAICFAIAWRLGLAVRSRAQGHARTRPRQAIGKNVIAMKLSVFAIAAALASVAGSLYAHYVTFVSAESFTVELTIYLLAMVILGGTGNLFGSIVGAVILAVLPELLKFVDMPSDIADRCGFISGCLILILRCHVSSSSPRPAARRKARRSTPGRGGGKGRGLAAGSAGSSRCRTEITLGGPHHQRSVEQRRKDDRVQSSHRLPAARASALPQAFMNGLKPHQIVRLGVALVPGSEALRLTVLENAGRCPPAEASIPYVYFAPGWCAGGETWGAH